MKEKAIRSGSKVRYIGTEKELMIGREFEVLHSYPSRGQVEIFAPVRHADGKIHRNKCIMSVKDFELIVKD